MVVPGKQVSLHKTGGPAKEPSPALPDGFIGLSCPECTILPFNGVASDIPRQATGPVEGDDAAARQETAFGLLAPLIRDNQSRLPPPETAGDCFDKARLPGGSGVEPPALNTRGGPETPS